MKDSQLSDGKIVRSLEPLNLEMPFEKLDGFSTPTELFYVRMHYPIPKIDGNKWRLRVEGEVEKPFELVPHVRNSGDLLAQDTFTAFRTGVSHATVQVKLRVG